MLLRLIFTLIFLCTTGPLTAADLDAALLAAARKGDLAEVKKLVGEGANIEAATRYATTPLYFAAKNGHAPVVEFLLSKGAKADVTDTFYKMHILLAAAEKGGAPVMKALLEAGATTPPTLLPGVAAQGDAAVLRLLIGELKPDAEALTAALQMAMAAKNEANAAVLREAGAKAPEMKTVTLPAETLGRYTGSYSNEAAGVFTFVITEGRLTGGPAGQSLELDAIDGRTFVPKLAPTAKIQFDAGTGPAAGFTLTNSGQTLVFKRTETKP